MKPTCTIDYDDELNMYIEWHGAVGMDDLPVAGTKLYAIPEGYSLVPDEPTEAMFKAAWSANTLRTIYKAMLKAAKESS